MFTSTRHIPPRSADLSQKESPHPTRKDAGDFLLYHETPAIVAGFQQGFADEQIANEK